MKTLTSLCKHKRNVQIDYVEWMKVFNNIESESESNVPLGV